jgi:hypothetical protein
MPAEPRRVLSARQVEVLAALANALAALAPILRQTCSRSGCPQPAALTFADPLEQLCTAHARERYRARDPLYVAPEEAQP